MMFDTRIFLTCSMESLEVSVNVKIICCRCQKVFRSFFFLISFNYVFEKILQRRYHIQVHDFSNIVI